MKTPQESVQKYSDSTLTSFQGSELLSSQEEPSQLISILQASITDTALPTQISSDQLPSIHQLTESIQLTPSNVEELPSVNK